MLGGESLRVSASAQPLQPTTRQAAEHAAMPLRIVRQRTIAILNLGGIPKWIPDRRQSLAPFTSFFSRASRKSPPTARGTVATPHQCQSWCRPQQYVLRQVYRMRGEIEHPSRFLVVFLANSRKGCAFGAV